MLWLLAVMVALANVRQPYPGLAPLQHVPTVLMVLAAPPVLRRWPMSNGAVGNILLFMLLHTLGGRYTYSNVPYDDWARALTGHDMTGTFHLARNGYDRVVHLGFGLLMVRPITEWMARHADCRRGVAILVAFLFVGAGSALYEIFEWLLTIVLAPGMADDYNGQQGDVWDSQKDMTMAIVGAALTAVRSVWGSGGKRAD